MKGSSSGLTHWVMEAERSDMLSASGTTGKNIPEPQNQVADVCVGGGLGEAKKKKEPGELSSLQVSWRAEQCLGSRDTHTCEGKRYAEGESQHPPHICCGLGSRCRWVIYSPQ